MKYSLRAAIAATFSAAVIVGCGGPGHVSGSDVINSAGGANDAHISFNADSCDGIENSTGEMKVKDLHAIDFESVDGVHFSATVDSTYFCSGNLDFDAPQCRCDIGYQEINFSYDSGNPKARGSGQGIACMADFGDNAAAKKEGGVGGLAIILVESGPFNGYYNVGATDVTQHACES